MSSDNFAAGQQWLLPMEPRDPDQEHRQASFLELFFDLCFVVAIAQVAAQLHHALAEDHVTSGIINFAMVFFAIWWAWMNYTWFASAYDNDDVPFRIASFVQITGALILAAGVQRGFTEQDYSVIVLGYVVMRTGLVSLWIRAALNDPKRKVTNIRYAVGVTVAQLGWVAIWLTGFWPIWCFIAMVIVELMVPIWAENVAKTPWHPDHIAERYGLLTIIVLGESVLAATNAVQVAFYEQGASFDAMIYMIIGGLLTLFSLWWLYFYKSAGHFLNKKPKVSFGWGYGHYFVFASAAAVGSGIGVNIDHITGHTSISDIGAAATFTIPVAIYLVVLWLVHIRPHQLGIKYTVFFLVGALLTVSATLSFWPVLITGLTTTFLVAVLIYISHFKKQESVA